jgi:large subunit ribosomal protein L10
VEAGAANEEERMTTPKKVEQVAALVDVIGRAEIAISAQYQGVSMAKQTELRAKLREAGAEMHVVKNTLLRIAAEQAGKPNFVELAEGPTAIIVGFDEPVGPSKALVEYLRANADSKVTIRRAVVGDEIVSEAYVRDLATLPTKEELVAKLAGNLVGKIAEFSGLLNAVQRDFVGLIEARAKQLEESEAA